LPHLYTDARLNDSDFDKEDYITSFVRGLARERLFSEAGLLGHQPDDLYDDDTTPVA